MSILKSLKGSWYLGKGSRAFKDGRYEQALRYFLSAIEYAKETESVGELAVRKEAIAETYLKLGHYDRARRYASESLETYKNLYSRDNTEIDKKAVNRVSRLLDAITYREKEKNLSGSEKGTGVNAQ
jgi:tetratricopeptide (TPR) repeat protein